MATETLDLALWRRIESYLEEALDLKKEDRAAWLETLAKTQPAIAREVDILLRERDRLDEQGFLAESAAKAIRLDEKESLKAPGCIIKRYMIETFVRRGCMRKMWLATRDDGRFLASRAWWRRGKRV